jgi:hypothetical protein
MSAASNDFRFEPQPGAAEWLSQHLEHAVARSPQLAELARRMLMETSTRLSDWVERLALAVSAAELSRFGFREERPGLWQNPHGLFPTVALLEQGTQVFLRVDDVVQFACAHGLTAHVVGAPLAPTRKLRVCAEEGVETWVVERHGGKLNDDAEQPTPKSVLRHLEAFRLRPRRCGNDEEGFAQALRLAHAAVLDLGPAYASELFFQAEREYWQSRNDAAALQKHRQDRLGLGWGNHDHHTYRSSRECFRGLVRVLEKLGLRCRERFYAGKEAGWGAQVMEHPDTGLMVFADVDMSADEVMGDFAHQGLPARDRLGTVGLWCKLHGEAFLEAGMHHLEAQFDFVHANAWFEQKEGVMAPFTNYKHLRQCFTVGQRWAVSPRRLHQALLQGWLSKEQVEVFLLDGAIGSHLEILERNDGFKGFNQKGISEIIAATDPRRVAAE